MSWPLSQDYNEAIQSPQTSFSDPELRGGQAAVNALGMPMPCSGNFADVYRVFCPASQRAFAVKCFTRQIPGLRERYQQISLYLEQVKLPFMVGFTFLDKGIQIRGDWYPILKMEWAEGMPLNQLVKNHLDKPQLLDKLCQMWVKLSARLREANLAHCDLQHGNVLLVPGSKTGLLGMKLVDYDGMCVPALTMLKSLEVGHPAYQHPQRARDGIFSLEVDRFSHLVIYTALRGVITFGREIWDKYDNGDNLLFCHDDFQKPKDSPLFEELAHGPTAEIRRLAQLLLQSLAQPLQTVPLLTDVIDQEKPGQSSSQIAAGKPRSAGNAATAPSPTAIKSGPMAAPSVVPTETAPAQTGLMPLLQKRPLLWGALGCAGGMVLAGTLAGVVIIIMLGMRSAPEPTNNLTADNKTTQREDKSTAAPTTESQKQKTNSDKLPPTTEPSVPVKSKPLPPPPVDNVDIAWIDLKKHVDPEKHRVRGFWHVDGNALVSDEESSTRLQLPFEPGDEYELRLIAERPAAVTTLHLVLPLPGSQVSVAFEAPGSVTTFEMIDKKLSINNLTTFKKSVMPPGQPCQIFCKIRKESIKISVGDTDIIHWQDNFARLSVPTSMWTPNPRAIAVGSSRGAIRFTALEVKPLTGPGTMLHGMPDENGDNSTKQKAFKERLAGTEWLNSKNEMFAWDGNGKFFHKGVSRGAQTIGDKAVRLIHDDKGAEYDELRFDRELTKFQQTNKTGKVITNIADGVRLPPGDWLDVRIIATVEGKDVLQFKQDTMRWESIAGKPPAKIKINGTELTWPKTYSIRFPATHALFGKPMDFSKVKFAKIRGKGNVSLEAGSDFLALTFDNLQQTSPELIEISLNLRLGDKPTNPISEIGRLIGHTDFINDIAVSPGGQHVASTSKDNSVRFWRLDLSKEVWRIQSLTDAMPQAIQFINSKEIIYGSSENKLLIASVETAKVGLNWSILSPPGDCMLPVAGGRRLLFSTERKVYSLDLQPEIKEGKSMAKALFELHKDSKKHAWIVAFSENGERALSTGEDETIRIWDTQAKKELFRLKKTTIAKTGLFSPAGDLLATADRNSPTADLWDAASGRALRRSAFFVSGSLGALAFSPDGKRLVSGHGDGGIRVWNVADLSEIARIKTQYGGVRQIRFLPDGKRIITTSSDKTIRVWSLPD